MSSAATFVIVGGGLAAAKAAEELRGRGYDGSLVVIGAEAHLPYERPPLSKGYLNGSAERDKVFVHPREWYANHDVTLLSSTSVASIDRADKVVRLSNGEAVSYQKLMLATGSAPRRLSLPGAGARGVHYLRTLDDCEALRTLLATGGRLAIIGAGWIGLEVASAARTAGMEVTVLESAELPLLRVLGPEIAAVFAQLHRDHGVDLRFGVQTTGILTDGGAVRGVELADGSAVEADAVLVAVGVDPRVELAEAAGLEVDNGVIVDEHLQTSDPDILAAGDVANAYHPLLRRRIRVEHWANALKQPAVAAATMMGESASYSDLPYFFTDQYDLGMEYVGYADAGSYDSVVIRGDLQAREFIAFWMAGSRVVAAMNVNVWDVVDQLKALILAGEAVDPAGLADPDRPLESLLD